MFGEKGYLRIKFSSCLPPLYIFCARYFFKFLGRFLLAFLSLFFFFFTRVYFTIFKKKPTKKRVNAVPTETRFAARVPFENSMRIQRRFSEKFVRRICISRNGVTVLERRVRTSARSSLEGTKSWSLPWGRVL